MFKKIHRFFEGDLSARRIALWGASFKPNTDDIRDAPSCALLEKLWQAGAMVRVYDPLARDNLKAAYPNEEKLTLCESAYAALENSDILVIVTEWEEFKHVDLTRVRQALNFPLIIDGRNIFKKEECKTHGLMYCGIGYGDELPQYSLQAI